MNLLLTVFSHIVIEFLTVMFVRTNNVFNKLVRIKNVLKVYNGSARKGHDCNGLLKSCCVGLYSRMVGYQSHCVLLT